MSWDAAIKISLAGRSSSDITDCEGWRRLGESNTVPRGELRFIRPLLVNRPVSHGRVLTV